MSDTLRPYGLQQARVPCLSLSPGVCSSSCLLSRWCHLTISSSVIPFSWWPQSFPASGSFSMTQLFDSGSQSITDSASASASVLPMDIQGWFALGLTGLISLLSKGLSRVFSSTTVWKHQFFRAQPSSWSNSNSSLNQHPKEGGISLIFHRSCTNCLRFTIWSSFSQRFYFWYLEICSERAETSFCGPRSVYPEEAEKYDKKEKEIND